MMKRMTLAILTLTLLLQTASGQYHGWRHSGSLYVLTTPEGANLPATASEAGFPLLVRLHKDWFDFSQAKAHGEDIRFAAGSGTPLAYEIDEWDPASGAAEHLDPSTCDQGQCAAGNKDVLGQARRGQSIERIGRLQCIQRIPQRLAHERPGEG